MSLGLLSAAYRESGENLKEADDRSRWGLLYEVNCSAGHAR
jgi:hypothetical protein